MFSLLLVFLLLLLGAFLIVQSATDPQDVQALGVFYTSLNSPPQLSGWTSNGGDPCGQSWKGITCSGSTVTSIQIPGLGLNGSLGYTLSDLLSLRTLDLSDNNIHETIPYQLPPNLTNMNLANNNFTGNLPYSISAMVSLVYFNVSHNFLSQVIGDFFGDMQSLAELDLSFNNLSGDLPNSIGSLSNLSSLYLQDNQLTGQINILSNLDLTTLNISNNHFNGWIPPDFGAIPNLSLDYGDADERGRLPKTITGSSILIGGNLFANVLAPPPPPHALPPFRRSHNYHNHRASHGPKGQILGHDHDKHKKGLTAGQITGIVIGSVLCSLFVALAAIFCPLNSGKGKGSKDTLWSPSGVLDTVTDKQVQEQNPGSASLTNLKPPLETMTVQEAHENNGYVKRPKIPGTVTPFTVASLQTATNSFSQEFLVGEGSLGRVYRAEFPNEKVLAVKKIDNAALSLQEVDNFLEAVSNMSRLRHPNVTTLVGYCVEHGQRLLVYEYVGIGTLHDMLHYATDGSALTWNARVRVALGMARALEYLHEVCLPSVVHRNFKSANILLDEELNPHLSDCGLAALTPYARRQISTEMVGSFGYSAPEFAMSGVYTVKSDVYSFGVVMLELLTGRKPLDSSRQRLEQSLVRWATPQLHDIDALAKMVDPALNGMYPAKSLSRFADIIALCIQPEPEFRPPMSEVVQSLVRLMQRASIIRRRSGEDLAISYRISEHEATADLSFYSAPHNIS